MKNKKLKIGVVIDQLLPGGVQIAAIEQVKNLRQLGIYAELLILMRKKYPADFSYLVKDIPHRYLSDSYPWPFRSTIKFPIFTFFSTLHLLSPFFAAKIVKEGSFDLLVSHGTTTCFTTLALWRKRKIPYLAVVHDPIQFILKKVYSKTFLRFFFSFLVPLSSFLERMFVKDALATVIDSGVHEQFIQKSYQTEPVIIPLGSQVPSKIPSKRGRMILALSRWQNEKNPQFLLHLLKSMPQAKLKIAGVWTKEADLREFKKIARLLGVEKRVTIVPQFEPADLPKLFSQARVWVHPNFEAFGMGGLEAASFGCPIIIPSGSGVTNLFQNGVDGFFPKKTTVAEYKRYIQPLLTNERLAHQMGKSAWMKACKECSWQAHTKKLARLGQELLEKLDFPKITAIEIGHAGGTGLSGGDKIFEEMVKRMPKGFQVEVITSPFGAKHWQEAQTRTKLKILKSNPFEEKPNPMPVFLSYCSRMIQTSILLLKKTRDLGILYSSTNILPDVLPAFIVKLKNPSLVWLARIHHLVPPPRQREGRLIVNIVSYLMQTLALFFMRTKADLVIALNETLYHRLLKMGFSKNKLKVLGAGIEFERIAKYHPQKTDFDGVYLGRLHAAKGVFDTVDIWQHVTKERNQAKLALIGAGPEYIRKELEAKIKRANLKKNIKILGFLPENKVYDFLKSAKVFLFTDHEAGWGIAIAEAMAAGLPVIGYNIGILGDIYKEGFRTVELGNTKKFANEVIELLKDEDQRKKLAQQALSQAQKLDWKKTTGKFIEILKPLL